MAKKNDAQDAVPQESIQFDCLAVTAVHVHVFQDMPNMGKMKAVADIVVNDQLQLRGLKVVDGQNGLFVSYPNDPFYKGEDYRSIYQPIGRQFRDHVENCILEKYQEILSGVASA